MAKMKNFLYYNKNKGLGNVDPTGTNPNELKLKSINGTFPSYSTPDMRKYLSNEELLIGLSKYESEINNPALTELEKIKHNNEIYFIKQELSDPRRYGIDIPNLFEEETPKNNLIPPANNSVVNQNTQDSAKKDAPQNNSIQPQNNNLTSQNTQSKEQESIFSPINLLIIGAIAFLLLNPKK